MHVAACLSVDDLAVSDGTAGAVVNRSGGKLGNENASSKDNRTPRSFPATVVKGKPNIVIGE